MPLSTEGKTDTPRPCKDRVVLGAPDKGTVLCSQSGSVLLPGLTEAWWNRSCITPASCTSAGDRLRFDSTEFPIVEVDTSYYAEGELREWIPRYTSLAEQAEKVLFTMNNRDQGIVNSRVMAGLLGTEEGALGPGSL